MNNDEIKAKYGYDEGKDKIDLMLNEVRADTAQQIFAYLKIAQINIESIDSEEVRRAVDFMVFDANKVELLKRKYGIKKVD